MKLKLTNESGDKGHSLSIKPLNYEMFLTVCVESRDFTMDPVVKRMIQRYNSEIQRNHSPRGIQKVKLQQKQPSKCEEKENKDSVNLIRRGNEWATYSEPQKSSRARTSPMLETHFNVIWSDTKQYSGSMKQSIEQVESHGVELTVMEEKNMPIEAIITDKYIETEKHMPIEKPMPIEIIVPRDSLETEKHMPIEKNISLDKHIQTQVAIPTDNHILADKHTLIDSQIPTEETLQTENHIVTNKHIVTGNHMPLEHHIERLIAISRHKPKEGNNILGLLERHMSIEKLISINKHLTFVKHMPIEAHVSVEVQDRKTLIDEDIAGPSDSDRYPLKLQDDSYYEKLAKDVGLYESNFNETILDDITKGPTFIPSDLLEHIEAELSQQCSLVKLLDHIPHTVNEYRTRTRLTRVAPRSIQTLSTHSTPSHNCLGLDKEIRRLTVVVYVQEMELTEALKAIESHKSDRNCSLSLIKTHLVAGLRLVEAKKQIEVLQLLQQASARDCYQDVDHIPDCMSGQLVLSGISVELQTGLRGVAAEHLVLVCSQSDHVACVSVRGMTSGNQLTFNTPLYFNNMNAHFQVSLQLYQLLPRVSSKVQNSTTLRTMKQLRKKLKLHSKTQSGVGVGSRRYVRLGGSVINIEHVTTMNNNGQLVLSMDMDDLSPVSSVVIKNVRRDVDLTDTCSGFLNIRLMSDNSPYWTRRWYHHCMYYLLSWSEPNGQETLDFLLLCHIDPESIKPADVGVCARSHSFTMKTRQETNMNVPLHRDGLGAEWTELVFAAESRQEMLKWCSHLKFAVSIMKLWNIVD